SETSSPDSASSSLSSAKGTTRSDVANKRILLPTVRTPVPGAAERPRSPARPASRDYEVPEPMERAGFGVAPGSTTSLFWLAGAQEREDRGRELRFGERGNVVRTLDDLDLATTEQLADTRNPVLHISGFVPSVDEQDRS